VAERGDPFVELLDEARHDEAVRARTRRRWLDQQGLEEAGFVGTLVDLADSGRLVVLRTETGRVHQGWLGEVAGDHCTVETTAGRPVVVALAAVAAVQPRNPLARERAVGDRRPTSSRTLREQLQRLAWSQPRVVVTTRGAADALSGELVAVGQDVVTLSLDGAGDRTCFVRLDAVAEVVVVPAPPAQGWAFDSG
jgi:hypothetical protein